MPQKLIIFGLGDIAEIAHFYFTQDNKIEVVAFTVDKEYIDKDKFCDKPIIAFEEIEKVYPPSDHKMFIAISYAKLNQVRTQKYQEAKERGYEFESYISPQATVATNAQIGENCFIFEDNTVQPFVKIGNNVTLWSGNHIGHHSVIEDNCFITSHVVISGGCTIGEYTFIGVNATLRDHLQIGKKCIIGAGAIIMKNTEEESVYVPEFTKVYGKKSSEVRL
jgi:sugar O-acyltransferase (sialic acid O-acetyltransferase NeuD family)